MLPTIEIRPVLITLLIVRFVLLAFAWRHMLSPQAGNKRFSPGNMGKNDLTHILTHTGSARSGRGRFQWTAGGGRLPGKAPNWRLFTDKVM